MENFNGDFPFSNEETKLDLKLDIQTIRDKYFETHPPETVTFRFPYNIRYEYGLERR